MDAEPSQLPDEASGVPTSDAPAAGAPATSEFERASTGPFPPYGPYPPFPPYSASPMPSQPGPYGPPVGYAPTWGSYSPYGIPAPALPPVPAKRSSRLKWALLASAMLLVLIVSGVGGTLAIAHWWLGLPVSATRPFVVMPSPTAPQVTASATPAGFFDFTDPLTSNVNGWAESSYCSFHDRTYHVNPGTAQAAHWCFAPAGTFSDFDMHVTVEEASGPLSYGYGLAFRITDTQNYYAFLVDAEGNAWLSKHVNGQRDVISPTWSPQTFVRGLGQSTTLRLVAQGSSYTCYVNGVEMGTVRDSTFARGRVAVYSGGSSLDAAFSDFEVAGEP